jgi:hypothetical protein
VNILQLIPNTEVITVSNVRKTHIAREVAFLLMENLGSGRLPSAQKGNFSKRHGLNFNAINTFGLAGSKVDVKIVTQALVVTLLFAAMLQPTIPLSLLR